MMSSDIRVRHVTTSFIEWISCRSSSSSEESSKTPRRKILLLHRSEKVRTYPGRWAGISGSIERGESALHCAQREIFEETGLKIVEDRCDQGATSVKLKLVRSGRPLLVRSSNYSTIFVVHPFLFRIVATAGNQESVPFDQAQQAIKIDWEHSEYKFVHPKSLLPGAQPPPQEKQHPEDYQFLSDDELVPQLKQTFRRVFLEDDDDGDSNGGGFLSRFRNELEKQVRDDKKEGAMGLAKRALDALAKAVDASSAPASSSTTTTLPDHIELVKNLTWHVMHIRTTMAPIANASIRAVARTLREVSFVPTDVETDSNSGYSNNISGYRLKEDATLEDFRQRFASNVRMVQAEIDEAVEKIIQHVRTSVVTDPPHTTVLTHSYSGTVTKVLAAINNNNNNSTTPRGPLHRVIVTESRPLLEGRRTIMDLKTRAPSIGQFTLCTDAAMAHIIFTEMKQRQQQQQQQQICLIVGADSILADGSIINKTGTFLLALAAQSAGIPMYVLCDTLKFRTESRHHQHHHGLDLDLDIEEQQQDVEEEDDDDDDELERGPAEELTDGMSPEERDKLGHVDIVNPVFEVVPASVFAASKTIRIVTENGVVVDEEDIKKVALGVKADRRLVVKDFDVD